MMKKICLLIAILLLLFSVCGCSTQGGNKETTEPAETEMTEETLIDQTEPVESAPVETVEAPPETTLPPLDENNLGDWT